MKLPPFVLLVRLGLICLLSLFVCQIARGGSATWSARDGGPPTERWDLPNNWAPNTVPNGPDDIATFAVSEGTSARISDNTEVNSIVFEPGASAFTITKPSYGFDATTLTISGAGVVNNSGILQTFIAGTASDGGDGVFEFTNSASAGGLTSFKAAGKGDAGKSKAIDGNNIGQIVFADFSSADHGVFVDEGGLNKHGFPVYFQGGEIFFTGNATAANGTFTVEGGLTVYALGGEIFFADQSTADHGTFVATGGSHDPSGGGLVSFANTASAGSGTFTTYGGKVAGADGATLVFAGNATAAQSTLIANGGLAGGAGAVIKLEEGSDASLARIELFDNGTLDVHYHNLPGATVGSLEGNGLAFLGAKRLSVGGSNADTTFSGVIKDSSLNGGGAGALTKEGSGQLILSGRNSYAAGTTVTAGILLVSNRAGSATGTGPVIVSAGTLGGGGTIAGAVTIGAGADLEPSVGIKQTATLTIEESLTFEADSTYTCRLRSNPAVVDQVVANEVTIESGAQLLFSVIGHGQVATGSILTVINNTATTPISGTFANLADGSTFIAGNNTFQVSYEGGDGNDLTLTVVP